MEKQETSPTRNPNYLDESMYGTIGDIMNFDDDAFNLGSQKANLRAEEPLRIDYTITTPEISDLFNMTPQGIYHLLKTLGITPLKKGRTNHITPLQIRRLFESRGFKYKFKSLAIACTKGGIGKTITSINTAIRANQYGARVLLVDADQQGNSTSGIGINGTNYYSLYDVISREAECRDVNVKDAIVRVTDTFHVLPSNTDNSLLERYLAVHGLPLDKLMKNIVDKLRDDYDLIIFDCSPALGNLNTSIILGCNHILMPLNPDDFSYRGVGITLKWIKDLTDNFEGSIKTKLSVFFNKFSLNTKSSQEYLKKSYEEPVLENLMMNSVITKSEEITKKLNNQNSIFETYQKSSIREDLDKLIRELLNIKEFENTESSKIQ